MASTLLIVEDDSFLAKAYQTQFEGDELLLKFAKNGDDALKLINEGPVNAIILDLVMPQKSGLDFLKRLRADEKHKDIPVVVATNMSAPNEKEQCERLGISEYCIKSDVSIAEIVEKVKRVLQK